MEAHIPLQWVHRVFSLLKRWGLGTYHGFRCEHIDTHLNEFIFRYNRRFYRHVSSETIPRLSAEYSPTPYWDIIGWENPQKGTKQSGNPPVAAKQRAGSKSMQPDHGHSNLSPTKAAMDHLHKPSREIMLSGRSGRHNLVTIVHYQNYSRRRGGFEG
jgi:hypothetical protein